MSFCPIETKLIMNYAKNKIRLCYRSSYKNNSKDNMKDDTKIASMRLNFKTTRWLCNKFYKANTVTRYKSMNNEK